MRVLITEPASWLGARLVERLSGEHEVTTLALTGAGDPLDRERLAAATAGQEAIIDLAHETTLGRTPLAALDRASRGCYNLITSAAVLRQYILTSSLASFERYPMHWQVTEQWAPRPRATVEQLAPYLAELTIREVARVRPLRAVGLRLGRLVESLARPAAEALHIEDAVEAVCLALRYAPPPPEPTQGWWVLHIPGGGRQARLPLGLAGRPDFGYRPRHDVTSGAELVAGEPARFAAPLGGQQAPRSGGAARRVVVYGAGGPLAAITSEALAADHLLRLTDRRPLAEIIAEGRPQSPGAPLPRLLPPPHETAVVDVTDEAQVIAAARDMEAIINCTVVRPDPVAAFRVNTLGAYTVMRAAVANGIRRVVHTGPQQVTFGAPAGYWHEIDLGDDVPARPGDHLYILSKFLGQEICRIFAEEHDLEVPTLLFSSFVNPLLPTTEPLGLFPFSISWEDAAAAMRQALRVPWLPHPFEIIHIVADLPHGRYRNEKAKRLLGWQPRDRLEQHWRREAIPTEPSA